MFVYTCDATSRAFLGIATPADVQRAIGTAFPWIEEAWAAAIWAEIPTTDVPAAPTSDVPAMASPDIRPMRDRVGPLSTTEAYLATSLVGDQGPSLAGQIGQAFLSSVQRSTAPDPSDGWLSLQSSGPTPSKWEHACWITTRELAEGALKRVVRPDACVVDQHGWHNEDRAREVLAIDAEFVALLSAYPAGRFSRLIDRVALAEKAIASVLEGPA